VWRRKEHAHHQGAGADMGHGRDIDLGRRLLGRDDRPALLLTTRSALTRSTGSRGGGNGAPPSPRPRWPSSRPARLPDSGPGTPYGVPGRHFRLLLLLL